MELHQRQQFDFLLMTAAERFVDRLIQRNQGPAQALERLREQPNGPGVWLDDFVDALFQDFLLDNPAGACFVLQALAKRRLSDPLPQADKVETLLQALARQLFGELLRSKVTEMLEQEALFTGGPG